MCRFSKYQTVMLTWIPRASDKSMSLLECQWQKSWGWLLFLQVTFTYINIDLIYYVDPYHGSVACKSILLYVLVWNELGTNACRATNIQFEWMFVMPWWTYPINKTFDFQQAYLHQLHLTYHSDSRMNFPTSMMSHVECAIIAMFTECTIVLHAHDVCKWKHHNR